MSFRKYSLRRSHLYTYRLTNGVGKKSPGSWRQLPDCWPQCVSGNKRVASQQHNHRHSHGGLFPPHLLQLIRTLN